MSELLLTRAERTRYLETSTYADVMAFIDGLKPLGAERLAVSDFGTSPEGRTLPLLVLSNRGLFSPAAAARAGLPVVLVQCGIHAGEVEGKEGALMLARDLLAGRHGDLLDRLVLVVAPLFNPDGNERINPAHRQLEIEHFRGQLGPDSGVGTRENAAGINLNRDYMRQQSLEMRLMQSRVCHVWNPHLTIDCHTTNGSIHCYDMTYDIPHVPDSGRHEPIEYMRNRVMPVVSAAVRASEGIESFWYGNFRRDEGGEGADWITYPHHPRFGGNYRGLTNRLDLLLETYSYIDFPARVRATYAFVRETLKYVAAHADEVLELLTSALLPPPRVAVSYRLQAFDAAVDILTRRPYTLAGRPVTERVAHVGRFIGIDPVSRPLAYAVPAHVAAHLQQHGLNLELPGERQLVAEVSTVSRRVVTAGRDILEAGSSTHWEFDVAPCRRALPDGWRLVKTAQQRGAIAAYLCEAGSDDGLEACGLLGELNAGEEFPAWRVHTID